MEEAMFQELKADEYNQRRDTCEGEAWGRENGSAPVWEGVVSGRFSTAEVFRDRNRIRK